MQYAPPYYYAGGNPPAPNGQQPQHQQHQQQPQQQPQQQQHQQHQQQHQQPQLHMSDHQLYQHPHGMPGYPMPLPHQHHPGLVHPGGDFNMLTKPKRKQVKNACVNCQKACKKCDDGRPCQRCIKYGLTDTCTNSIRKERKKGIKRGPYKRRNQANGEAPSPSNSTYSAGTATASNVPTSYPAYANYDAYQNATTTAPGVPYNNPMQQYVMAMQQQQAMYQNMPYQPSMAAAAAAAAATSSSPSLAHPQPSTPLSHPSPTNTPVAANEQKETNLSNSEGTPAAGENNTKPGEDDDGSKLNILSQLCSDVLDRSPKEEHATMTPPPTTTTTTTTTTSSVQDQSSPAGELQTAPILSTPVSSSPSSANASPTMYKQDAPQVVYPQQQQQGQPNWQGQQQQQQW